MKPTKIAGVLGGMGPRATVAFLDEIVESTPAAKDWDHVRVITDCNPHIPSRSRYVLYGEASPLPGMLDSAQRLERYPVDFLAIPCNSAVIFVPDLRRSLAIPVLDIREVAVAELVATGASLSRVAALGGPVTYLRSTYRETLEGQGLTLLDHGPALQRDVELLIEELKVGRAEPRHTEALVRIVTTLAREHGASAVVFACTELACVPRVELPIPVVDSSRALARRVVAMARG